MRKPVQIKGDRCATKYPIVLIHGVGFRDRQWLGYWGRIPAALTEQGARIFYGDQDAWGCIEENAAKLKRNIQRVLRRCRAEKVNIIAHSKGGLEARYMIHDLGMAPRVASLTTISSPHRGSKTYDYFGNAPTGLYKLVADGVDRISRLMGDSNPDFYYASQQFSTRFCEQFNRRTVDEQGVYYQSYAAIMKRSFSDWLLMLPHFFVKKMEGDNDGLVTVESAKWGEFKGVIGGKRIRGISHADIVDRFKTNPSGIYIPGLYIDMVEELKNKGF